ncbi:MAG: hypothetical protein KKF67_01710 [Nanoarchaeota archaeon]|nr:hypothetical protein [Nanoarchaeota archaeon]
MEDEIISYELSKEHDLAVRLNGEYTEFMVLKRGDIGKSVRFESHEAYQKRINGKRDLRQ